MFAIFVIICLVIGVIAGPQTFADNRAKEMRKSSVLYKAKNVIAIIGGIVLIGCIILANL